MIEADRPTVAERYATATEAHSFKIDIKRTGPADVLIAAGLAGDGLGVSLVRLRAEFDTARGAVRGTGNNSLTERTDPPPFSARSYRRTRMRRPTGSNGPGFSATRQRLSRVPIPQAPAPHGVVGWRQPTAAWPVSRSTTRLSAAWQAWTALLRP